MCARGSWRALLCGPSTSPLDVKARVSRANTASQGFAWRIVAAALLPFAVELAYVLLTRWTHRFTPWSDIGSRAMSVLVGAWCVWGLPIALSRRVLALLFYVPVVAFLLYHYVYGIVWGVFGEAI